MKERKEDRKEKIPTKTHPIKSHSTKCYMGRLTINDR